MKREVRRTSAQFLNAVSVAILATGFIGPATAGSAQLWVAGASVAIAVALHILAILVST
jgi:hypothetical protein